MKLLHFAAILVAPAMSLQAKDVVPSMPSANPMPTSMPQEPVKPSTAPPVLKPVAKPVMPTDISPVMEKNPVALPEIPMSEKLAMEFPKYDKDSSGELNRMEFSTWIAEAKSAADGKVPSKKMLMDAFRKADTDKSRTVNIAELAKYLS